MASVFRTGVRGASHIRTTSNTFYLVNTPPVAGQVLTASTSSAGIWLTPSFGINVIGPLNSSATANVMDISRNILTVHVASASAYGVVYGGGWNTSGQRNRNTCLGYGAGAMFDSSLGATATDNTFCGYTAGNQCIGSRNTFIGSGAGANITTGCDNIIIGVNVGKSLSGDASGNILIGNTCMNFTTSGINNVIIGHNTLTGVIPVVKNSVVIGCNNLNNLSGVGLDSCIIVGPQIEISTGSTATITNVTALGGPNTIPANASAMLLFPLSQIPATGTGVALNMTTSGQLVRSVSSMKYKTVLHSYDGSSNFIYNLSGKIFYFNADTRCTPRIGYYADDLHAMGASHHVIYDIQPDGSYGVEGIDYASLIVPVINELKNLKTRLTNVMDRINNIQPV